MTKDELIWVVIRTTGFVLVLLAILYVPEAIGAAVMLSYFAYPGGTSEGLRMSVGIERQQLITSTLYLLVHLILGFYLLRRGAWIHRLLRYSMPERSNSTFERDARNNGARPSP